MAGPVTIDEDATGGDETAAVEQTLRVETLDPVRLFEEIAKIEAAEAAAKGASEDAAPKASGEPAEEEPPYEGTVVMENAPAGPRTTNAAWAAKSKRRGSSTPPPPMDPGQIGLERGPGQTFVLTRSDPPPAMQPVPTWPPPLAMGAPEDSTLSRRRPRRDSGALLAAGLVVVLLAMLAIARFAFGL